ncbi:MAG: DUF4468 domain-containing protein [Taibaiella sp.]|nr:DUF4468 domain-containing protein [Taibaiella sp.]
MRYPLVLIIAVLLLSFNSSRAQVPYLGSRILYTDSVVLDTSYNIERLFHNAENWFLNHYETADTKLTIDNRTTQQIAGVGVKSIPHGAGAPGRIFFQFIINVKHGSYTYAIDSMFTIGIEGRIYYSDIYQEEHFAKGKKRWTDKYRSQALTDMDTFIRGVVKLLEENMRK